MADHFPYGCRYQRPKLGDRVRISQNHTNREIVGWQYELNMDYYDRQLAEARAATWFVRQVEEGKRCPYRIGTDDPNVSESNICRLIVFEFGEILPVGNDVVMEVDDA